MAVAYVGWALDTTLESILSIFWAFAISLVESRDVPDIYSKQLLDQRFSRVHESDTKPVRPAPNIERMGILVESLCTEKSSRRLATIL